MGFRMSRRALLSLFATCFVTVLLFLALPLSTLARSSYAAATGQPCSTCHYNPAGGGDRNAFGRAFEAIPNHSTDPAGAYAQLTSAAPTPTAAPAPQPTAAPAPTATEGPAFRLGFATLAFLIPNIVGTPVEAEHYGANGDSLQRTTTGMMVWRKADNWTAFTDGNTTWINGPFGVQSRLNTQLFPWESPSWRGASAGSERDSAGSSSDEPEQEDNDR